MTVREEIILKEIRELGHGKYPLKLVENSTTNYLNLNNKNEDSLYLEVIYKDKNNRFLMGIVKDAKTKDSWLMDYLSIKELLKHGYICNLLYNEDGNTINNHNNKIQDNNYVKYIEGDLDADLPNLSNNFKYVIHIDHPLNAMGRLRHNIIGVCFNLNSDIIYYKVHNPICDSIMSIDELKKLFKKVKDIGKFCIDKASRNAPLLQYYILIEHGDYAEMTNKLSAQDLVDIDITKGNNKNKINYNQLNPKVSKIMFNEQSVVSIPIPSKFSSEKEFVAAFSSMDANDIDYISFDYGEYDLSIIAQLLTSNYTELHKLPGINIADFIHKNIKNFINNGNTLNKSAVELPANKPVAKPVIKQVINTKVSVTEDDNSNIVDSDVAYITDDGKVRLKVVFNKEKDTKHIVLVREDLKNNKVIMTGSEASYEEYLNKTFDLTSIKRAISIIINDYNKSRKLHEVLEELKLA